MNVVMAGSANPQKLGVLDAPVLPVLEVHRVTVVSLGAGRTRRMVLVQLARMLVCCGGTKLVHDLLSAATTAFLRLLCR